VTLVGERGCIVSNGVTIDGVPYDTHEQVCLSLGSIADLEENRTLVVARQLDKHDNIATMLRPVDGGQHPTPPLEPTPDATRADQAAYELAMLGYIEALAVFRRAIGQRISRMVVPPVVGCVQRVLGSDYFLLNQRNEDRVPTSTLIPYKTKLRPRPLFRLHIAEIKV